MFSITDWLEAPGHISVAVDCLALGGCAFTTYVAYRATKARDRMDALYRLAKSALAEQATQSLPAAEDEGPVIVRVPISAPQAVALTRMDLRQWVVPSAEQMAAWNRFGSNGRVDG